MASVNKVILVGNCGRDPEVRYLPSGMAVCDISIATSTKRKDKNTGEYIEETQWHRVKFFDKKAEAIGQYVTKGSPLYIEGRISYGKFTNKDGNEVNTCDILAEEFQFLGNKQSAQEPREQAPQRPASRAQPQRTAPAATGSGFDDMADDIPF